MPKLVCPLVGSHFRPPAKQLLTALAAGTMLELVAEPDNAYDPDAIKVVFHMHDLTPDVSMDRIDEALEGTGYDWNDLTSGPVHLGYVGATNGKVCKQRGEPGNLAVLEMAQKLEALWPLPAKLAFAPDGQAMVEIAL